MQTLPAAAHATGDIFMMPVLSQQYRPKDFLYWEAGNSTALRNAWTSAIAGGSDWTQIVTWSDFSESGEIEPYTDRSLSNEIGTGYYDLNAYFASWFLTGQAPPITHDVLYYFYRREPPDAAAAAQTTATTAANGQAPENDVELVAFLTAPGTLAISDRRTDLLAERPGRHDLDEDPAAERRPSLLADAGRRVGDRRAGRGDRRGPGRARFGGARSHLLERQRLEGRPLSDHGAVTGHQTTALSTGKSLESPLISPSAPRNTQAPRIVRRPC